MESPFVKTETWTLTKLLYFKKKIQVKLLYFTKRTGFSASYMSKFLKSAKTGPFFLGKLYKLYEINCDDIG